MKNDVMPFFKQLKKDELIKLCVEVKETLATGLVIPQAKVKNTSFGIADLWSIRKNMKTARGRWNNKHSVFLIRG